MNYFKEKKGEALVFSFGAACAAAALTCSRLSCCSE